MHIYEFLTFVEVCGHVTMTPVSGHKVGSTQYYSHYMLQHYYFPSVREPWGAEQDILLERYDNSK